MGITAGKLVTITAEFTASINSVDTPVDPDLVTFKFIKPGTSPVTYIYGADAELVKTAVGKYSVSLDTTNSPGTWYWKFYSQGTYQDAAQGTFTVERDLV